MRQQDVVITGLGVVSPIGIGAEEFWASALAGKPGVGLLSLFDGSALPAPCRIVAEVTNFHSNDWFPGPEGKRAGRFSQFAVGAAKMAMQDSGLVSGSVPPDALQVSIGTSMSGVVDIHESSFTAFLRGQNMGPWTVLEYPAHAATSHVAIAAGARGRSTTIATACAAGLDAIASAAERVARGEAIVAIAGGCETPLSAYALTAFYRTGVLSQWEGPPSEACRPFERRRSGLVLGEGAAVVIVEQGSHARDRGAKIYARILGADSAAEGEHLRKVDQTGSTITKVMQSALRKAELKPGDIDYIAAHGNGMIDYDAAETAGIKATFRKQAYDIPISSLKAMCGQALAASGPMQVVASCLALRDKRVPPTINYEEPDPQCDLDYVPNESRTVRIRNVMIHAHSMGGSHTVMILSEP